MNQCVDDRCHLPVLNKMAPPEPIEHAGPEKAGTTIQSRFLDPTGLLFEICESVTLNDIDFLHAETVQDQAVKLLRFCGHIYKDGCNLEEIAGPENEDTAELLIQNASCNYKIVELVLYSLSLLLCLAVMVFNMMEIVVIAKHRVLRTIPNKFIMSLAFSDFLFGFSMMYSTVMNILLAAAELNYNYDQLESYLEVRSNEVLCLVLDGPGVLFACMMASVLTLMAIAVEKYIAIFHPLKYYQLLSNLKIVAMLAAIWLVSLTFGLLPLMGWNNFTGVCLFVEKTNYEYVITWSSMCLLSACITLVIYVRIFMTARKHARQIAQRQAKFGHSLTSYCPTGHHRSASTVMEQVEVTEHTSQTPGHQPQLRASSSNESLRKKTKNPLKKSRSAFSFTGSINPPVKAVKTIAIILGTFYLCWLPLLIYFLACPTSYSNFVISWLVMVALINSLLNPLVYGFRNRPIRAGIKGMCTRHRRVSDCSSLQRVLDTVPDTHDHVTFY